MHPHCGSSLHTPVVICLLPPSRWIFFLVLLFQFFSFPSKQTLKHPPHQNKTPDLFFLPHLVEFGFTAALVPAVVLRHGAPAVPTLPLLTCALWVAGHWSPLALPLRFVAFTSLWGGLCNLFFSCVDAQGRCAPWQPGL